MLCYRDMTYCPMYITCSKGNSCHRALTPDICAAAKKLQLPIAQWLGTPACYEKKHGDSNA